ncbi:hypothetical protein LguiB_020018 [Lonicera macranthoides]
MKNDDIKKDILEAIVERENWKLEDVRVSNLDLGSAKYGTLQRYEVRIRIGKSKLDFKLWDQVSRWKNFKKVVVGDFESLANKVSSKAVLDVLQIEGPFELRVAGDDELSMMLPDWWPSQVSWLVSLSALSISKSSSSPAVPKIEFTPQMNSSHTGFKQVLVGEGITMEVKSAQGVSLFHTSDLGIQSNRSLVTGETTAAFWSNGDSLCMPLLPINILGSASLVAYRTRNPNAPIEYKFPSRETIELLPEKCYTKRKYKKRECTINSLRPRIALLEKLLRSFLGDRIGKNASLGFVKAKIHVSTVFHFQLELERDIRSNDTVWTTLAEWRTRPTVKTVLFEVVAKIGTKGLVPVTIKKVRPFIGVDSSAWSSLMSNISFTQFPSILVPPEALTLDVKW